MSFLAPRLRLRDPSSKKLVRLLVRVVDSAFPPSLVLLVRNYGYQMQSYRDTLAKYKLLDLLQLVVVASILIVIDYTMLDAYEKHCDWPFKT